MGPSQLLIASGSKSSLPRHSDYHKNLTKLKKHNPNGPGQYTLPSLFDDFAKSVKNGTTSSIVGVKHNPNFHMMARPSQKLYLSKEHLRCNYLAGSPPSTKYSPVADKTFDAMQVKAADAQSNFSYAPRFPKDSKMN